MPDIGLRVVRLGEMLREMAYDGLLNVYRTRFLGR